MTEAQEKFDLFTRLGKTRAAIAGGLSGLFRGKQAVADDSDFDELEDHLIMSDIGVEASARIVGRLRAQATKECLKSSQQLRGLLKEELFQILQPSVSTLDLLDRAAAEAAISTRIAEPLDLDVITAASGIQRIVNTNMGGDLRLAFQARGEDPRRFALAAFGGAGPMHAAALAVDLEIPHVLVPPNPGLTSAMGLLQTKVRHVYLRSSVGLVSEFSTERMEAHFVELTDRAMNDVREEGFASDSVLIRRQCDMRYLHQGYELAVDCPSGVVYETTRTVLKLAFDDVHQRVYGASAPDEDAEIVTFRVIVEIEVPRLASSSIKLGDGNAAHAQTGERPLWDNAIGTFTTAAVFDRKLLLGGDRIEGPAIVEQFDSTTVVPAGQSAEVDPYGILVISTGTAF